MNDTAEYAHRAVPSDRHTFTVTAAPCPQVLLRVLGIIAQHSLIPLLVECAQRDGRLHARIIVKGLGSGRAEIMREKMAGMVLVQRATLTPQRREG